MQQQAGSSAEQNSSLNSKPGRAGTAELMVMLSLHVDSAEDKATHITPFLLLGSAISAGDINALRQQKISHIINLCPSLQPCYPREFQYLCVPLRDAIDQPIRGVLESCINCIDAARSQGELVLFFFASGSSVRNSDGNLSGQSH